MQAHMFGHGVDKPCLAERSECEWNGKPRDEC